MERHTTDRSLPALGVASANLDHLHYFGRGAPHSDMAMADTADLKWLTLLDGAPLVALARRATGRAWPRLSGSDLLVPVLDWAQASHVSVGFLGGMPVMLSELKARLDRDFPDLVVAGFWSPSREELGDEVANERLTRDMAAAGVDVLVVGLGKPRQEVWIQRFGVGSGAQVLLAFGASADFLAGSVARAPGWMRQRGLEWSYRLVANRVGLAPATSSKAP